MSATKAKTTSNNGFVSYPIRVLLIEHDGAIGEHREREQVGDADHAVAQAAAGAFARVHEHALGHCRRSQQLGMALPIRYEPRVVEDHGDWRCIDSSDINIDIDSCHVQWRHIVATDDSKIQRRYCHHQHQGQDAVPHADGTGTGDDGGSHRESAAPRANVGDESEGGSSSTSSTNSSSATRLLPSSRSNTSARSLALSLASQISLLRILVARRVLFLLLACK